VVGLNVVGCNVVGEDVIVGCILVADVEEKLLLVSLFEALPDDEDNVG
jgi:hypothetical protein